MKQEPQERVGHFPSALMFFCLEAYLTVEGTTVSLSPTPKASIRLHGSVLVKSQAIFVFGSTISREGSKHWLKVRT